MQILRQNHKSLRLLSFSYFYFIRESRKNKLSVEVNGKEFIKINILILKSQQRFRGEKDSVFIEDVNKILLSANENKRKQSIDSTETYAYGTSKSLACKKEEIECNNMIKKYKND